MRPSLGIAAITVVAATVLAALIFATVVHTYTDSVSVDSAFAIWNDESLVVFVPRRHVGSSGTILQQLAAPVAPWAGTRAFAPKLAFTSDAIILRVENGVVHTSRRAPWSPSVPRPRFVDGRLLIFGGVWSGTQIDTMDRNEYVRLMASARPDDAGGWRSQFLLEGPASPDVRMRIGGEALTLKSWRTADGVRIDLVRDAAAGAASSTRLFELRSESRAVSAREFESLFSGARSAGFLPMGIR